MASRSEKAQRLASRAVQIGLLLAVLVLWYLATNFWGVNRLLLPNPVAVWHQFIEVLRSGAFLPDLRVTATEFAVAFTLATSSGIMVGYFVSRSRYWVRVLEPLLAGIFSIPIILFLPLYVLFFGLGLESKIALGTTISFFPIVLATIAGFSNVDRVLVTAARSMGATNYQLFRHVLLPAALPVIMGGLRIGFTIALLSILGSETIASLAGLGHHIVELAENMDMARMFAYIVFVVLMVALLNAVVSRLEARGRRYR
ncbi:MAG TPA: ABC transporter permease [Xanthobacteraceae bacterium]|nr:ABC transporter permease [Xanthobacteraceae bacterium]